MIPCLVPLASRYSAIAAGGPAFRHVGGLAGGLADGQCRYRMHPPSVITHVCRAGPPDELQKNSILGVPCRLPAATGTAMEAQLACLLLSPVPTLLLQLG